MQIGKSDKENEIDLFYINVEASRFELNSEIFPNH